MVAAYQIALAVQGDSGATVILRGDPQQVSPA
jgi:hypothetical protein